MAEADYVGYTTTGVLCEQNDLYRGQAGGHLDADQSNTILGEFRRFKDDPNNYSSNSNKCISIDVVDMWQAHESHRMDPKYHLFKAQEQQILPDGWIKKSISTLMVRREEVVHPEENPDSRVIVMTLSQTGEIKHREAGKGKNPPEWLGMYFEDSPSTWYQAHSGDLVFSSIDLWKGCIAVVDQEFDRALVTKEFPIYKMLSDEILPEFLAILLRSRYYQRAFRAITTGHSNRRRTQSADFEAIEVCFPVDKNVQRSLIAEVLQARENLRNSSNALKNSIMQFSSIIDGRGLEELPELESEEN